MRFRDGLLAGAVALALVLNCWFSSPAFAVDSLAVCGTDMTQSTTFLPTTGTIHALVIWIADPGVNPSLADSLIPSFWDDLADSLHTYYASMSHGLLNVSVRTNGAVAGRGVYFYRLQAATWHSERKLIVLER